MEKFKILRYLNYVGEFNYTRQNKKRYPIINRNFLWKINLSKKNVV